VSGAIIGSILNNVESAIATAAVDVVGVYNQNYNQLFSGARPIRARVNPKAKLMDHPIETGATITDHRVFLPTEIELNLVFTPATYAVDYQSVMSAYMSNNLLTVQTRTDTYSNMVIQGPPHEETADLADTISMILSLRQVTIVSSQSAAIANSPTPANPVNSTTVSRGAQQGAPATTTQSNSLTTGGGGSSSTLYSWFYGTSKV
jgi:hypothetical protein